MGFYPTKTEIEGAIKQLQVELPLNLPHFLVLANFMENSNCERGGSPLGSSSMDAT